MNSKGYGAEMNADTICEFLEFVFKRNDDIADTGKRGTPICIWGTHGLGKTHLITEIAKEKGWKLAYCAPAQFEEMGDLHGLPEIVDPTPGVPGDEFTIYRPPEWVPREAGPGILLLDDFNRADDRILRGLMQLLQNFELFSWQLPPGWQIVATANPEGDDYSVTPIDDAMLTRMLHATLVFDAKIWANWALKNGGDPRGVDFVLGNPELVTGKRTTPRTLMQLFEQTISIKDLTKEETIIRGLAYSALDPEVADAFMRYIKEDLKVLMSAEEILDAKDIKSWEEKFIALSKDQDENYRMDRLSIICSRIVTFIGNLNNKSNPNRLNNFKHLLIAGLIPKDLTQSLYRDVLKYPEAKEWVRDKDIAKFILS